MSDWLQDAQGIAQQSEHLACKLLHASSTSLLQSLARPYQQWGFVLSGMLQLPMNLRMRICAHMLQKQPLVALLGLLP